MLRESLQRSAARTATFDAWRPRLFNAAEEDDARELEALLAERPDIEVIDTIAEQLRELVRVRAPKEKLSDAEADVRAEAELAGGSPLEYGTWVCYPWSRRVAHVLPVEAYRALRSDRNRYKITPEEQARLRGARIGVIGLSVGQSAALTLAMEGVGGAFRLTDFDALSLSNMNRLRAGCTDLGVAKVVLAARAMFETDPYLDIELFDQGVTPQNMDALLKGPDGAAPLDLIVEECDDLYVKIRLRERARAQRIPVVMASSDRGLIDIERFDREPERPLFHGLVGSLRAEDLVGLSTKDKVPHVLRIIDETRLSHRLMASMLEIEETLDSWPQLASAVALGGAMATDVARRILLDELTVSGRFYVDLDELVADGAAIDLTPAEAEAEGVAADDVQAPALPSGGHGLEPAVIEGLVAHAVRAPSGGNIQPWRFVYHEGALSCFVDRSRSLMLDYGDRASFLAVGAAVENLVLAAGTAGLDAICEPFPDAAQPDLACTVRLKPAARPGPPPPLAAHIAARASARGRPPRRPLEPEDARALQTAAAVAGGRLHLLSEAEPLAELADMMAHNDQLVLLNPVTHAATMSELRWSLEEARRTRDGIEVDSLELSAADRAGLRMIARKHVVRLLGAIGVGGALGTLTRKWVNAASAMALLTFPGGDEAAYFHGGRALERTWLTATARHVAVHPMATLPYLFLRLKHGGDGLSPRQLDCLPRQRERYRQLWDLGDPAAEVLMFRLSYADAPERLSLRRNVRDVLTFA